MIIDARWGLELGKMGRFRAWVANRAFMMGFGTYLRALDFVDGVGILERRRWSSPRSSNSHWTASPGSRPMAAAKARGKLT